MKKDYNKTDRIILLLQALVKAPLLTLSENKVKTILGDPSRAQWYKLIKELCVDVGERKAILIEKKDEEGNINYQLNQCDWYLYIEGRQQLEFIMNSYRELGHLFPQFEIEGFQTNSKNLERKFYYLCKNKIRHEKEIKHNLIEKIIKALIGNTKLLIDYKGTNDQKPKTIDIYPLTLTQYRDDLYLIAMKNELKEDNIRAYKISRITKIQELKEKFKFPTSTKWNPKAYFEKSSGIITGPLKEAVYRVFGDSKKILKEKQLFDSELAKETKDYDEYKCHYTNVDEFIGLLFIYGQDIEIMSDEKLKIAFKEKAEKIIRRNK